MSRLLLNNGNQSSRVRSTSTLRTRECQRSHCGSLSLMMTHSSSCLTQVFTTLKVQTCFATGVLSSSFNASSRLRKEGMNNLNVYLEYTLSLLCMSGQDMRGSLDFSATQKAICLAISRWISVLYFPSKTPQMELMVMIGVLKLAQCCQLTMPNPPLIPARLEQLLAGSIDKVNLGVHAVQSSEKTLLLIEALLLLHCCQSK